MQLTLTLSYYTQVSSSADENHLKLWQLNFHYLVPSFTLKT